MRKLFTFLALAVFVLKTFGGTCEGIMICPHGNKVRIKMGTVRAPCENCHHKEEVRAEIQFHLEGNSCSDILIADEKKDPFVKTLNFEFSKAREKLDNSIASWKNHFKISAQKTNSPILRQVLNEHTRFKNRKKQSLPLII